MKYKIVFVTRHMMMGGIEKALIAMLRQLPKEKFDITILTEFSGGELINEIPNHVKIRKIFNNEQRTVIRVWECLRKGKFISAFQIFFFTYLLNKKNLSEFDKYKYMARSRTKEKEKYDLAISYSSPLFFPIVYTVTNITARQKVAWIHNDVSDLKSSYYTKLVKKVKKYLKQYDNIFCVSNHALLKFEEVFPKTAKNISVFYNIVDKVHLKQLAENDSYMDRFSGIRILTVGRLEDAKGQDLIPEALYKLISKGYKVRWYCIGDGELRADLEMKIQKYGLEKNLILLGTKRNPYPYIKDCDLYVQPSRHEAYCITVAEARVFNKPIITTDTGASEQIINKQTGVIVHFNVDEMVEEIKRIITNASFRNMLMENLRLDTVDTTKEMEKLCKIL